MSGYQYPKGKLDRYCYDIYGKFTVCANLPLFEEFPRTELDKPDLIINVVDDIDPDLKDAVKLRDGFYGAENERWVYLSRNFFRKRIEIFLRNLEDQTELWINRNLIRLIKMSFPPRDLFTFWNLVNAVSLTKLLQKNCTFVHAASLDYNGHGILLPAYPNTGKTVTCLKLLSQNVPNDTINGGIRVLSDDLTLLDSSGFSYELKSFMASLVAIKESGIDIRTKFTTLKRLSDSLSFYLSKLPFFPVYRYIGYIDVKQRISNRQASVNKSKIDLICILEKGADEVKKINKDDALRKIWSINRRELYLFPSSIIWTYFYFNNDLQLPELQNRERMIIKNALDNAECYILRVSDNHSYVLLLQDFLRRW